MGEFLVPEWLDKFGTYITDRGFLIRMATVTGGLALIVAGILLLVRRQAGAAATQVAKAVI